MFFALILIAASELGILSLFLYISFYLQTLTGHSFLTVKFETYNLTEKSDIVCLIMNDLVHHQ